jgi:serine/threonine protein kinase
VGPSAYSIRDTMTLEIGQLVDNKYRINRQIGEGGMGAVYEGENVRINRRVAIKVLHAAFTGNSEVMARFEREAQAAGRIGNDHILEVLDFGALGDGDHFIVMEFLDGESLSQRIKRLGRLTAHQLAPIMRQVLVGLGAAHAAGIVHRDLKPDNIFILKEKAGTPDFVKIIDFGISKFQPLSGDGMKMTRTGAVMGTPYYMSPEQASGSVEADQRSDIYSLGVIMFEAATGQVPFDAATFNQLMFKIVLSEVPRPETIAHDLEPAFASLISKAMARDVGQRFQSTRDFITALDNWRAHGHAVSLPPEATPGALPDGVRASLVSSPGLLATPGSGVKPAVSGTAGNWASSQAGGGAAVKKSKAGLVIAAAVSAAVLVAGGAFAFAVLGKKAEAPEAPSAAAAVAAPSSIPVPAEPVAKVVAPAPSVEVPVAASAAPVAEASAAPAAPRAPAAAPAAKSFRPAQKPAAAKPAAPEPKPAKPAAAAKPVGGAPDFGY